MSKGRIAEGYDTVVLQPGAVVEDMTGQWHRVNTRGPHTSKGCTILYAGSTGTHMTLSGPALIGASPWEAPNASWAQEACRPVTVGAGERVSLKVRDPAPTDEHRARIWVSPPREPFILEFDSDKLRGLLGKPHDVEGLVHELHVNWVSSWYLPGGDIDTVHLFGVNGQIMLQPEHTSWRRPLWKALKPGWAYGEDTPWNHDPDQIVDAMTILREVPT